MISNIIYTKTIEQISEELNAAHIYLGMAGWCENKGYEGVAHFFNKQVEEELSHLDYAYDYLIENGYTLDKPKIDTSLVPNTNFKGVLELFEKSLEHEKTVTKVVKKFMSVAESENDENTVKLVDWFIDEQQDDEDMFNMIIDDIRSIGVDNIEIIENMLSATRQ